MCTFERPVELTAMLDAIAAQSRLPDVLLVVDNSPDRTGEPLVESHQLVRACDCHYIADGVNTGPAGAFNRGLEVLTRSMGTDDFAILLDDDDPPTRSDIFEDLLVEAKSLLHLPSFAGIGLRGGNLDRRIGIVRPAPRGEQPPIQTVDHLHGGYLPMYRIGACREVRPFDPELFWGFEELEFGRRLRNNGYDLFVAAQVWSRNRPEVAKRRRATFRLSKPTWRDYFRHRNLLVVLRRERAWTALVVTIGLRLLAKPLLLAYQSPRLAAAQLRMNVRAAVDAFQSQVPDRRDLVDDGSGHQGRRCS